MTEGELLQLQSDVRELKDIEEIKRLRSRYFQYVDAQDWTRWAEEILTEDFYFDSDAGVLQGRDAIVAYISKALEGAQTVHHGHTPDIAITGPETATAVWAMNDYVTMPGADQTTYVIRGYGYYRDEYVRTPSGWRLKKSAMSRLRVDAEGVPHFAASSDQQ
jgi:hypothetical protein